MDGVQKFSARVIDYAERLSDMADAAEGKRHHGVGKTTRWMVLPAAGAALYAVARSDRVSRQAKGVLSDAKSRAAELPDDLMGRVRQSTASSRNGAQAASRKRTTRKPTTRRRSTKTASNAR